MSTVSEPPGPEESAPFFPTAEGGAAPADEHFGAAALHYLIVVDVSNIPPLLREPMQAFLVRAAFDFCGEGHFNLWDNVQSIAIRCEAVPGKMEMFSRRVRETATLWATNRTVRINQYTMAYQKPL